MPPEELVAGLPPVMGAVLRRCLEKDPNRRYPRAAEIAAELRKSLSRAGAEEEDTSATQEVAEETAEGAVEKTAPAPFAAPATSAAVVPSRPLAPPPSPAPAPTPPAAAPKTAPPVAPLPGAALPLGKSSGQVQVSAALQRMRNQRLVQFGFLGLAALSAAAIAALWLLGRDSQRPPALPVAPAATSAPSVDAVLDEVRLQIGRGELEAALAGLARVEAADPGNATARVLRETVERQSRDQPATSELDQRVADGLSVAREEFARKRYEQAITAASAVLAEVPGNPDAEKLVADSRAAQERLKERQRTAKAAAPAAPPVSVPPTSATVPAVRAPAAGPEAVGNAQLAIQFFSDVSEGTLTIYAGERQIVREPFKFVRKTGFLRSEKVSGAMNFQRALAAGPMQLRVYVSLPGKPTRSVMVDADLAGGSATKLEVRVSADGQATANLTE
jgi:hypothetical protein